MTRYSVSGSPTPDCTTPDTGVSAGLQNGHPYWTWTNSIGTWRLMTIFSTVRALYGTIGGVESRWVRNGTVAGEYIASLNAIGTVTVAEEEFSDSSDSSSSQSSSSSSSQSSAVIDLPRSLTITISGSFSLSATVEKP